MNIPTKHKQIHRQRTDLWLPRGRAEEEGRIGSLGLADANLYYIGWINNKILLYSTENYIQHPVINHNRKAYEKIYITESLCYTAEMNTTL